MPATRSRFTVALWVARGVVLLFGLIVTTVAFLGLVDEQLALDHLGPWWYLGLIGLAAILVALGSPRRARLPSD